MAPSRSRTSTRTTSSRRWRMTSSPTAIRGARSSGSFGRASARATGSRCRVSATSSSGCAASARRCSTGTISATSSATSVKRLQDVLDTERQGIDRRVDAARQAAESGEPAAESHRRELERIAAERRAALDALPEDLGGAVRGLQDYQFVDPEAWQKFQELMLRLRQEMTQSLFGQLKQGLQGMGSQGTDGLREMLGDLNRLLRQQAAGGRPDVGGLHGPLGPDVPGRPEPRPAARPAGAAVRAAPVPDGEPHAGAASRARGAPAGDARRPGDAGGARPSLASISTGSGWLSRRGDTGRRATRRSRSRRRSG